MQPPAGVFKAWGWKVQPLLLFLNPRGWKMQPFCCFQGLGLETATPPPVFKPWGWKLEFEATVISVYDEPCTSYVLMPQASGSQYPLGLPQEGPKALPGPPITPQGLPETPGRRPGGHRDAPGRPPGARLKNLRQSSARPHPSQDGKSQTTRPPNDQATIHIGPAECAKRLNNG